MASEMERQGFSIPLLIGGATTSGAHTAREDRAGVRRARGARARCLARGGRGQQAAQRRHARAVRRDHEGRVPRRCAERARRRGGGEATDATVEARAHAASQIDLVEAWRRCRRSWARACSTTTRWTSWWSCIDWTPFFQTWELRGAYPDDPERSRGGRAGDDAVGDAESMLERIVRGGAAARARRLGFWPANADGDDIVLYTDASRASERRTSCTACASRSTRPTGGPTSASPTSWRPLKRAWPTTWAPSP